MVRLLIFLAAVVGVVAAQASELDATRLAGALRVREGYRGVDGRLGELGPWQLREITWRQHMAGKPFAMARQEGPARLCAERHIEWLRRELRRIGLPDSVFNVAAAWNAGLDRYTTGRAPERAYLYARDVERLYLQ